MKNRIAQLAAALAVLLIVAGYAWLQWQRYTPGCQEADAAGYMIVAERMARLEPLAVRQDDPFLYHEHIWVENSRGDVLAKYSPGQPLLMAIGLRLGGEAGAYAVNPIAGGLALAGAYLLFRLWCSRTASVLALLALAANPIFLLFAGYPLAHSTDLCLVTWAMYFLWRWSRRPGAGWAVGAGLAMGFAQLVRPASAIFALVVLAAVAVAIVRGRRQRAIPWKATATLLLAYAVFPLAHAWYNHVFYGSAFRTGYDLCNEQSAFSLSDFYRNAGFATNSLGGAGLAIFLGMGLAGIATRKSRGDLLMLSLWVAPMGLLYVSYYWAPAISPTSYIRFFLPLFPALIGCSFWLLDRSGVPRWQSLVAMVLLAALAVFARADEIDRASDTTMHNRMLMQRALARVAQGRLADGAVVFVEPPGAFHLGVGKRFRIYSAQAFRPEYVKQQFFLPPERVARQQPSRRERILRFYEENDDRLADLLRETIARQLGAGRQAAFIIPARMRWRQQDALGDGFVMSPIYEWDFDLGGSARFGKWGVYTVAAVTPPAAATTLTAATTAAPAAQSQPEEDN